MLRIKDMCIDLDGTVTCGQIFRYEKEADNSYTIILSDRVINIKKDKNDLVVTSNKEEDLENVIRNYFDLNRSYDEMDKEILKSDNTLENIVKSCAGYKIINQSNFECAISYILSANNGVPQIRNSLNLISEKYGEKIIFNGKYLYLCGKLIETWNPFVGSKRSIRRCISSKIHSSNVTESRLTKPCCSAASKTERSRQQVNSVNI